MCETPDIIFREDGYSLLMKAVALNYVSIMQLLIESGSNVHFVSTLINETPILLTQSQEALQILLQANANINDMKSKHAQHVEEHADVKGTFNFFLSEHVLW